MGPSDCDMTLTTTRFSIFHLKNEETKLLTTVFFCYHHRRPVNISVPPLAKVYLVEVSCEKRFYVRFATPQREVPTKKC
jgi:hypothetical protein